MDKLTIVQDNDLIAASYRLDLDEMRLLNLALAKIDSRKKNIGVIEIHPDEFAAMYNIDKKNIWRNMKKSVLGLMQKPIKLYLNDEKDQPQEKILSWLDEAIYYVNQDDSSKIKIEFSRKVEPYLFDLKGNFTKVNFENASRLTTPFSFRLYQWLIREHRMKSNQYYELTLTLDDIKFASQLTDSYKVWGDFKKFVITPALDAINQKTNLSVTFDTIKRGHKTHALTFIYIDEHAKLEAGEEVEFSAQKPERPRLLRRPRVITGTHAEGEWQRKNLNLLKQYRVELQAWDPAAKLTIADLKKLVEYSCIHDQRLHEKVAAELAQRQVTKKIPTN